jgi:hypothetical protein
MTQVNLVVETTIHLLLSSMGVVEVLYNNLAIKTISVFPNHPVQILPPLPLTLEVVRVISKLTKNLTNKTFVFIAQHALTLDL